MCGIVGIIGTRDVAPSLVDSLKRLEYRGYDSAGVATLHNGKMERRRAPGKLINLDKLLQAQPLSGTIGIGHTRWATHGVPNETNAHPHFSGNIAVVHNGIIENFRPLQRALEADGYVFISQTDTEIVAHLVHREIARAQSAQEGFHNALKHLEGAFALAVLVANGEDLLFAARLGPPLAIGHGTGEMFIGSDALALAPFTDEITYLNDGDWAVVRREGATIFDMSGDEVTRKMVRSVGQTAIVDKGNHRHFMEKEIHEQPEVLANTLARYLDFAAGKAKPTEKALDFAKIERLAISACGTAYYAGLVAKYWFERYARLPVDLDIASEFRYREMPLRAGDAAIFISQSGETADTLACLRYCKEQGLTIGSIVNAVESTIARESDVVMPIVAGPEIGVASTKAFTSQLAVLASLVVAAASQRGHLTPDQERDMVDALAEAPRMARQVLKLESQIEHMARDLAGAKSALYLGRDVSFPIALEGALKLKEISYIHAEGYAAGELKHGPIALIDEDMPVFVIAPHDKMFDKTISNLQEVAARGGKITLITDVTGDKSVDFAHTTKLVLPDMHPILTPMIFTLPVQLLAYHTAVYMGTDVDQPRNLAKSVTVE